MRHRSLVLIGLAAATSILLARVRQHRTSVFDATIFAALRGKEPRLLRRVIARLDEPSGVLIQTALCAAAVGRHKGVRAALRTTAAPLLALGACAILKHAVDRARPPRHLFARKGMQSFPSSHTAGTAALAWVLASDVAESRGVRAAMALGACADVGIVAIARVGDGAHWPTDTLAGAAIGVAAAEAAIAAIEGLV